MLQVKKKTVFINNRIPFLNLPMYQVIENTYQECGATTGLIILLTDSWMILHWLDEEK
jgi:hypothetical protein